MQFKLCDVKLHNEDDHTKHRKSDHHRKLQVKLENEFKTQITSVCDICRISELKSDTSYIFCHNDSHMDTFHLIWNEVKTSNKPGQDDVAAVCQRLAMIDICCD